MLGAEWDAFSGMRLVGALCIWCSKTSVVFVTYVVCQRGDTAQNIHQEPFICLPSQFANATSTTAYTLLR